MPCLQYLPSLTPEDKSIELLTQAYPALITLGRVRYPTKADYKPKMKYLDEIFRKGVLGGYVHCSENARVARFLVDQIAVFAEEMTIWSVKHLKVCPTHIPQDSLFV